MFEKQANSNLPTGFSNGSVKAGAKSNGDQGSSTQYTTRYALSYHFERLHYKHCEIDCDALQPPNITDIGYKLNILTQPISSDINVS